MHQHEHIPQAQHITAEPACAKPQSKYVHIRVRQLNQADRVGEIQHVLLATPSVGILPQGLGACNASPLRESDKSRYVLLVTSFAGIVPQGLGACNACPPRENDKRRNASLATPSIGILAQGLGTCNVPPPRENGNTRNGVLVTPSLGTLPQGSGVYDASLPRESAMGRDAPLLSPYDGYLPPGSGARGAPDPREGETIHRTDPHAAPNAHPSEASITSGRSSPDVEIALRCGYGSSRRKSYLLAPRLHARPVETYCSALFGEECLSLANPDAPSDQREVKSFSPAADVPPAADEPVGDGSPPQGSTAAQVVRIEETPLTSPTVLTVPIFVDELNSPSAQVTEDAPTSRRTGQEPPATSRGNRNNS